MELLERVLQTFVNVNWKAVQTDISQPFASLSVCVLSRYRLSCTEALAHPWMVSFTPLHCRSTKSLNKGKMKRFLAKHKWKVVQLRHELRILSRH